MADECPGLECTPCEAALFNYSIVNYPLYTNAELSFFIPCPTGMVCVDAEGNVIEGITVVIPAGAVSYRPTTEEENDPDVVNERLNDLAETLAKTRYTPSGPPGGGGTTGGGGLNPRPTLFYNDPVLVQCADDGEGDFPAVNFFIGPGTVFIPGGVFSSPISTAAATALASDLANSLLSTFGNCHWTNDEINLPCQGGQFGGPIIIAAGTFTSYISKADANAQALAAAQDLAAITCHWENTEQIVFCPEGETGGPFTVPAGTYSSFISQADADAQALADAQAQADAGCVGCTNFPVQDLTWNQTGPFGGGSSGSASGGTGSATLDGTGNDNISFSAQLANSCNSYQISIAVTWDIKANSGFFPPPPFPNPFSFLQVLIDEVLVLDETALSANMPPGTCTTNANNTILTHMIEPDAYSIANGHHKIQFSCGQDVIGGACGCTFNFSITPLTPP